MTTLSQIIGQEAKRFEEKAATRRLVQKRLEKTEELLEQLWHHHRSQAKPVSDKCSAKYHLSLASRIGEILGK